VYLVKLYRKAVTLSGEAVASFEEFHARFDVTTTSQWAEMEENALTQGGVGFEIYKFEADSGACRVTKTLQ
jgi:hypothetical protein